ncbi:MAG: hypothetical protein V3W19_14380, partial [Desulfatiglandales bacterium]
MDWSSPPDEKQFPDAFEISERIVPPNLPTTLFFQSTLNKYHVDSAKTVGDAHAKYIEGICGAICDGIDKWMKLATVVGVVVNGPTGMLLPGNVIGPPLGPLILASAPMNTPQEMKYSNAIANAFGPLWLAWHMGLMGTLAYPPLASVPAPVAPPTPNVPMPLIALTSVGEAGLSPASLKGMMFANLADPQALHASDLFDAISQAFNTVFQTFKSTTTMKNVMGTGQVPSFKPPFSPVGPVVGGTGIGPPSGIS